MRRIGHTTPGETLTKLATLKQLLKSDKPRDAEAFTQLCQRDERGRMWPKETMSTLERKFLDVWQWLNGPDLERETLFDLEAGGGRKWRADFVHRSTKTMIEIEGGAWTGGRHTRGTGFTEDATKYLRAWELGWGVVRLTEKQITEQDVRRIIARLRDAGGTAEQLPPPEWIVQHNAVAESRRDQIDAIALELNSLVSPARPEWVGSMETAD